MKLSQVQAAIAAKFAANATLAAMGAPIQFSFFTSDEDARAAIATALSTKYVCFEIGPVTAPTPVDNPMPNQTFPRAECAVFVAENRTTAHTPSGLELVETVIAAICTSLSRGQVVFQCTGYDSAQHEDGYVLHVINFAVPVLIS